MSERISDSKLYQKLMNHNAWTKGTLLDVNSLGAGGSKNHLILANIQTKIGNLMTNSQLWDLIDSIGSYEYANGLTKKELKESDTACQKIQKEYQRLSEGGKYNYHFISDMVKDAGVRPMTAVKGDDLN